MELRGRVALVTGASRGLGAAVAAQLAQHNVAVVAAARSRADCDALIGDIQTAGGRGVAVECDVCESSDLERAVREGESAFGTVDILINNAGRVDPVARLAELTPGDFDKTLRVNLQGAFNAVHAVLPGMLNAGGGTIVNISSGAAMRPLEGWTSYCASKAGLHMLTRSIALELGERGVLAFGYQPGTVRTTMQELIRSTGVNHISQMTPEQHRPPEIPAKGVVYLCAPAADDLAGEELSIGDESYWRRVCDVFPD